MPGAAWQGKDWHTSLGEASTLVSSAVWLPHCLGWPPHGVLLWRLEVTLWTLGSPVGDNSLHTQLFSESLARATGRSGGTESLQHVVAEQGLCCMI